VKKYCTKIIAVWLLIAAAHLAIGFCFESLLSATVQVLPARAEAMPTELVGDLDACSQHNTAAVSRDYQSNFTIPYNFLTGANSVLVSGLNDTVRPQPTSSKSQTTLPCCDGSAQSSLVAPTRWFETSKLAALVFTVTRPTLLTLAPVATIYYPPIISPPKLLAVKTTVLRL
jgi:hypothetical protein